MLPDDPLSWALLLAAAVGIGFAKTAVGGVASLSVVAFAAVLPARPSTGAVLPLLLVGDLVAVAVYRRHAQWSTLLRLLPGVLPGLVVGALFLGAVDDTVTRRCIGLSLLLLGALHVITRSRRVATSPAGEGETVTTTPAGSAPEAPPGRTRPEAPPAPEPRGSATGPPGRPSRAHPSVCRRWSLIGAAGVAAGFTTMTANAAGPVMTLYLLAVRLPVLHVLGTGAWFFLLVNLAKVPFSVGLGLISTESLLLDAALVPALLAGAALGVFVIGRLRQRRFEQVALVAGVIPAALLLF